MSETLLIIAGVAVFFVTVIGVLIYFYSILIGLDSIESVATAEEPMPGPVESDG